MEDFELKRMFEQRRDSFSNIIDGIRQDRKQSKQFMWEQANTWFNNLALVCFGLGGALIPIAASVHLPGHKTHEFLLWIGVGLMLIDGVFILLRVFSEINETRLRMEVANLREEYQLVRATNHLEEMLLGTANVKTLEEDADEMVEEYKQLGQESENYRHHSYRLDFDKDIANGIFLSGLFCTLFAVVPLRLRFIAITYLVLLMLFLLDWLKRAGREKETMRIHKSLMDKIADEEKRMFNESMDRIP